MHSNRWLPTLVTAALALSLALPCGAAQVGTVLNSTSDASGNLIDLTYDVDGSSETLSANSLIGSTLLLSTLQGRLGAPGAGDANRFWTLNGAPEPTRAQALRSLGDKYMGTALQDCASTSQHDVLFDRLIVPGPGPEIFIYHGGLNDPFVLLDASGQPALTIPNAAGNAISVALTSQFKAWYLQDNVNYAVVGTFPHVNTQSRVVALDLDEGDLAAISGLRFAGGSCDYVYEILGRQPVASGYTIASFNPAVVFSGIDPAQQAALDAAVGVTGFLIEDFEDTTLVDGLTMSYNGLPDGSPPLIASAFTDAIWDGTSYHVSGTLDTGGGITFRVAGGARSFGVGIADVDTVEVRLFVNDQDLGPINQLPNWVKLGDNVRDVYLRVDADPGQPISTVRIERIAAPGTFNDGVFIDHVAIDPLQTFALGNPAPVAAGTTGLNLASIWVDVDGDGDLDVVNEREGLRWSENDGFDPQGWTVRTIDASTAVKQYIASADVDGDGDTDLLVTENFAGVFWYDNDGATPPSWTRRTISTTESQPFFVGAADLDRDGDLDVLATDTSNAGGPAGSVAWFENDGAAIPNWTRRALATGGHYVAEIGDFDRDGDLDVLSAANGCSPQVTLLESDGAATPTFTPRSIGTLNDIPVYSSVGDLDDDGDLDLVIAAQNCSSGGNLLWFESDGAAVPSYTQHVISPSVYRSVELTDIDLDGDLDIATTGFGGNTVFENIGSSPTRWVGRLRPGASGYWLDSGDYDRDGDVDLLASLSGSDTVIMENLTVHRNAAFPLRTQIASYSGPFAERPFAIGDVDGDGNLDLVVGSSDSTNQLFLNNGSPIPITGTTEFFSPVINPFNGVTGVDITADVQYTEGVLLEDFDGDGDLDFAAINRVVPTRLYLNNGSADPFNGVAGTDLPGSTQTYGVGAADIDGDGDIDIVLGSCCNLPLQVIPNNGTADPFNGVTALSYPSVDTKALSIADLDGDGDLDLVQAGAESRGSRVRYNNGTGDPFAGQPEIQLGFDLTTQIRLTDVGDVDGDGDIDVVSSGTGGTIYLYSNNGTADPFNGVGETPIQLADVQTAFARLGDLDADGDLDIFRTGFQTSPEVLFNNGTSSPFTGVVPTNIGFDASTDPRNLAIGDMNRDGKPDLVATYLAFGSPQGLQLFLNGGGQFNESAAGCISGFAAVEGAEIPLVSVDEELNARPGDSPGRMASVVVDFRDPPATLSTILDTIRIYRDNGDGTWDPDGDRLVATYDVASFPGGANGRYELRFPAEPSSIVAAPVKFIVTGQIDPNATTGLLPNLERGISGGSTSSTRMIDANAGALLSRANRFGSTCSATYTLFANYEVDDTSDTPDSLAGNGLCATATGSCTLRAAITEANAIPGRGSITLPAGTYSLSVSGVGEDLNATGDLDITEYLEITGAGAGQTIIDGGSIDRVLNIHGATTVVLQGLTLRNGSTTGPGGGLYVAGAGTVELQDCVVEGNTAASNGGGIAADPGSFVQTVDSRITGNTAEFSSGGGIYSNGTVDVVWSEISDNSADIGGGGLYTDSVLQVLSSTISGNGAVGSFGGGILADGSAFVALDNSTVVGNDAAGAGGGVLVNGTATFNAASSILAGNVAGGPSDCTGNLLSGGYTLVGNTSGCSVTSLTPGTDLLNVDPLVGPLGDYGGVTLTHKLQFGSPAIDSGSCGGSASERDQTGQTRPIDEPFTANADDGCDIGAYESGLGQTLPIIEVPIRWCGVNGAPSIDDPGLVGEATANDVMRRRHEIASDSTYEPDAGIVFRSAGNFIIEDYPILDDADTTLGMPGDVVLDIDNSDFSEFQDLINACRAAWESLDQDIQGVTAVQINRFIGPDGNVLEVLGAGGRAIFGDRAGQANAGQLMLIDGFYRSFADPADLSERLFGHEVGHALSLLHGNGIDDDVDTLLDNDDDQAAGLPRFDGPNLLQYRDGDDLTVAQAQQLRAHILLTIPDGTVQPFSDTIADGTPIDQEIKSILQFGYDELTELELKSLLQWELKSLLQFELKSLLQWELKSFLEWELKSLLQFELKSLLQFENASVVQYGMDYSGSAPTDEATFNISMRALPWFAPIRPDTRYYLYLDLDNDDSTGGYPVDFANPSEPGFNFPGMNNLDGDPLLGQELGVDLIIQVTMEVECPNQECDTFTQSDVFAFDDTLQQYDLVYTEIDPENVASALSLYVDNGGEPLAYDDVPLGFSFRPKVPNQVLFDAGWSFATGPNGPVPNPIGVEVFTEIDCQGRLFNDDPTAPLADCQCTDCADCPDYPGCNAGVGTPRQLSGTRVVTDRNNGSLTFQPPILPFATASPLLAVEGQMVTVHVFDLPTDVVGLVEVTLDGIQLGTVPTSAIDPSGEVSLTVALPFGKLGDQRLSTGIVGRAPRATTQITISESLAAPDNDGDGDPDVSDPDDDNDGVTDVDEDAAGSDPFNGFECGDSDLDTCDDCVFGGFNPADDGRDTDLDGLCNEGDTDDDNDGVLDTIDGEPLNPNACGDTDEDRCDDCAVISNVPSPNNDGPDADGDGVCDFSDRNARPIAQCTDVQVAANAQCEATASVDDGSYDPEGLVASLTETPGAPYGLGDTTVTLTITDTAGEFAECTGTVTVSDATDPAIASCAADRTLIAGELGGTAALDDLTGEVSATDACGILGVSQDPAAGTALSAGTHDVTFTATDLGGNETSCIAVVTVLDRVLSSNEKIKVKFDEHEDGSECDDDDDEQGPPAHDAPHCFTQLDLDGDLHLRNAATLPIDVRQPGATDVQAHLVVSLSGQVISDEMLLIDVKNEDDEIWEYKRSGSAPKLGVKKFKLDWKETASYDSHDGTGLGTDVPRIETRFIGYDETDTKLSFTDVPRPFQVQFDDPLGGVFVIDVLDAQGNATATPGGDYDLKDKKNTLTLVLPFRLTPDTTVRFTADGGQTLTDIPVDTEFNYQPAGAKYKLDLDETAISDLLCSDATTPVNSQSSPELEVQLFIGNAPNEVVGIVLVGPGDWNLIDARKWKLAP